MKPKKNIKIKLAKSAGFCFGVRRALTIAFQAAGKHKNIYMLGDIVHNEQVVRQIEQAGIKKLKRFSSGCGKTLVIRAHGSSLDILNKAAQAGWRIIDATCPMVKEIHRVVTEMEGKGYRIIVIGDKKHDEVLGIIGQLKQKAVVIENPQEVPSARLKGIDKACVVAQSTQNLDKVLKIVGALKKRIKEVRFFNTICSPTRTKQEEIKSMPRQNDVMIVIGSRTSANTKRLYEISKSINDRTYWVQSRQEIRPEWLKEALSVGVTAGASTPESTTEEIIAYLKKFPLK